MRGKALTSAISLRVCSQLTSDQLVLPEPDVALDWTNMATSKAELDNIDCKLLAELQANARISFAELSRRVSLSTPSVAERVKRLEESGIILGYHAHVSPAAVGHSVEAFVKVSIAGDKLLRFAASVKKIDEVLECYRITGAESFLVLVAVRDTAHLQEVIDRFMPYVATNTSIVLDAPVRWNPVIPETYKKVK